MTKEYLSSEEQFIQIRMAAETIKNYPNIAPWLQPQIGLVCGTGLGGLTDAIDSSIEIPYRHIPHCPSPTAPGHESGHLILGKIGDKRIIAMRGRFHYYEGYSMWEVTFLVRVMLYLGIDLLITTNATGGINDAFSIGDVMVVKNHNSLIGGLPDPLIGLNCLDLGPRFVDTSKVYDENLRGLFIKTARETENFYFPIWEGVLTAITGPCYGNPDENKFLENNGIDAVGMSIIPEAKVAAHHGCKILALSIITDKLIGKDKQEVPIDPKTVEEVANTTGKKLAPIVAAFIKRLDS